jgi:hypothetical protein
MKQAMVEHSSSASHSFLLDDDSTLPFVANDILAQMDDKVRSRGVHYSCNVLNHKVDKTCGMDVYVLDVLLPLAEQPASSAGMLLAINPLHHPIVP